MRIQWGCVSAIAMALALAAPAYANDDVAGAPSDATASQSGVGQIVVTAQRRSENLQDVPVAVSAISGDRLAASGVTNIADMQVAVPSLSVQNIAGYLGTHLRGVGSIANGPGFENPIALYVDGVYYANQSFGLAGFNNVQRVEVLKGPQGTLFGRNATGGLISIVSKDPGQIFEANGSIDYGNYDRLEAKLYAGGPVSDTLSADIALRYSRQGEGWGTNLFNGLDQSAVDNDVAMRSKVIWKSGNVKFTLIGDYGYRRNSMVAFRSTPGSMVLPGVPAPTYPGKWDVNTNVQPLVETRGGGVSLKGEVDLGFATISDLVAWREANFTSRFDYDGSPLPLTGVLIRQKDSQVSNELQLTSNSGGPVSWVGGIFYFKARGEAVPITVSSASDPALNPAYPLTSAILSGRQDTDSVAGYVQATYKFTDRLSLTAGVRYSWEKRSLAGRVDGGLDLPGHPVINLVPTINQSRTFEQPSFRAAIDYHAADNVMIYASFNTGFKSGGFNVTIPTDPAYLPEKLTAYEVGEKAELFNRKVRLNTALFYYDYKDLQVQIPRPVGTGFDNAPKSEIYGADVDLTVVPVEGLEITASATWLESKFKNFPDAPISSVSGGTPVVLGSVAGNRLPYTPKFVSNISVKYTVPIGNDELTLVGGWLQSSRFFFEPDNVTSQKAYSQFNASATFKFDDGRYFVGVYGNNLSNVLVRSAVQSTPSGPRFDVLQSPRTFGARAGFNF